MKYSQRDEEDVILANTPELGFYLEIGSYDPFVFSNSRALFDRGWGGIMIEPSPERFISLMKAYDGVPRVTLVNALATPNSDALTKFYASPDAVGTSVETAYEKWKGHAKFTPVYVPAIPINKIITSLNIKADFISIDTEGSSFEILKVLNLDALGCNLACVEMDNNGSELHGWFKTRGFLSIHQTAENMIAKRQ